MIAYIEEYNLSEDKNNIIKQSQLYWSDQSEAHSNQFDSVHFNKNKTINISQYVNFEGNLLPKRWKNHQREQFCIMEMGFGCAINFIHTAQQFLNFTKNAASVKLKRLHYISFEQSPLSIEALKKILQSYPEFCDLVKQLVTQYPIKLVGCHRLSFNDGQILLDLWFGYTHHQINNLNEQDGGFADAWYLNKLFLDKEPKNQYFSFFKNIQKHSRQHATFVMSPATEKVKEYLIKTSFNITSCKVTQDEKEILIGNFDNPSSVKHSKQLSANSKDVAIIGGGISGLCTALALAKRGNQVNVYTKGELGTGASGNLQGALYPLLNQQHDALGQLFTNAYLFALNYYKDINNQHPFAHKFNGVIQLAYDQSSTKKLQKIINAKLPEQLVHWIEPETTNELAGVSIDHPALFYPTGGWLSPRQVIMSLQAKLAEFTNVTIKCNHPINTFSFQYKKNGQTEWALKAVLNEPSNLTKKDTENDEQKSTEFRHNTLIIAAGFDTLKFEQCRAVPLSAARGQVSHINTNDVISPLKRTLCHEGYLTPSIQDKHCMGATFKRHDDDIDYRASEQTDNYLKLKKCIENKPWVDSIIIDDQAHIGIRCTTRDHFPYVGALTDYEQLKNEYQLNNKPSDQLEVLPNAYLLTGLGSRGLCSAPLLGELLASEINNESLPVDKNIYKKMQIPRQWINYMLKNKALKD